MLFLWLLALQLVVSETTNENLALCQLPRERWRIRKQGVLFHACPECIECACRLKLETTVNNLAICVRISRKNPLASCTALNGTFCGHVLQEIASQGLKNTREGDEKTNFWHR